MSNHVAPKFKKFTHWKSCICVGPILQSVESISTLNIISFPWKPQRWRLDNNYLYCWSMRNNQQWLSSWETGNFIYFKNTYLTPQPPTIPKYVMDTLNKPIKNIPKGLQSTFVLRPIVSCSFSQFSSETFSSQQAHKYRSCPSRECEVARELSLKFLWFRPPSYHISTWKAGQHWRRRE